jgi:type II secretory pathway pseudopilin PulG
MRPVIRTRDDEAGFSIVELLTVAFIIVVMAAVAIPKIGRYFRNYQMSAAVREVSGEIQAAKNRAVMKNVNFGSVFYIRSATTYRTALEDDQTPPRLPRALSLVEAEDTATFPAQVTNIRTLPGDVVFGTGCTATPAPNDIGIRFTRLGQACNPGVAAGECRVDLVNPSAAPPLVYNDNATGAAICLVQPSTGLRRLIRISPGGRIASREGQG